MKYKQFQYVSDVGPNGKVEGLHYGDVGAILDCYPNDIYDVEFSEADGSTRVLVILAGDLLTPFKKYAH